MEEDDFLYEVDPLAEEDFIQNPLEMFIAAVGEAIQLGGRAVKRTLEKIYRKPARETAFPKAVDPDEEIKRLERISAERAKNLLLARETKEANAAGLTVPELRIEKEAKAQRAVLTAAKRTQNLILAQDALAAKKKGMEQGTMEWGVEKLHQKKQDELLASERLRNLHKAQNARRRKHG